jgi:dipeptidyl-peptidase-4
MILIACNSNQIRHSFTRTIIYTILLQRNWQSCSISVQSRLSPNGKKIAYAKENNLYVYDLASKVYADYYGRKKMPLLMVLRTGFMRRICFCKSIWLGKDSKKLAYIRFDESQVPEFSMSMFNKICTQRWNV